MTITPLKNTLSKKSSSKDVILYTGCCCCCCCILAPIGSYITEKIINKKYPERGSVWKHFFVNVVIGLITFYFMILGIFRIESLYKTNLIGGLTPKPNIIWILIGLVTFVAMYILFYLYSLKWFNAELGESTRLKVVFWETLLTIVLWMVFFGISILVFFRFLFS